MRPARRLGRAGHRRQCCIVSVRVAVRLGRHLLGNDTRFVQQLIQRGRHLRIVAMVALDAGEQVPWLRPRCRW